MFAAGGGREESVLIFFMFLCCHLLFRHPPIFLSFFSSTSFSVPCLPLAGGDNIDWRVVEQKLKTLRCL